MNPFEMVIGIVLIVSVSSIIRARYGIVRPRRGRDDAYAAPQRDDGEADRLRGEVRDLKDRIAVLERIVTDSDRNRGLSLEREIEALRHDRETR
jgi:hypothetical protein